MEREKRHDAVCAGVSGALSAAAFVLCRAYPALAGVWMIAAGLAGTAFLWYLLSRIAFCGSEKFRRKHFRRALFDALAVPVYLALNLAASALAGEAGGAGAFASAVMTLSAAATALGAPAAYLVLGVLAIVHGARHLRETGEGEGRAYREGPLAAAALLFALCVSAALMTLFYISI